MSPRVAFKMATQADDDYIVDISQGATLPTSDASGRDMTVMAISKEGFINRVLRTANTFGPEPDGSDNFLYVMDGRNYAARMYRSRSAILGSWSFSEPSRVSSQRANKCPRTLLGGTVGQSGI